MTIKTLRDFGVIAHHLSIMIKDFNILINHQTCINLIIGYKINDGTSQK